MLIAPHELGQSNPVDPMTVSPGTLDPANCRTPSTTTVNGPAGTWMETLIGTSMSGSPRATEPRMNRTMTVEPLECLGDVPTQNDTVLSLTVWLGRGVGDGVEVTDGPAGTVDVQPANVTTKAITTTAVNLPVPPTLRIMPLPKTAHASVERSRADRQGTASAIYQARRFGYRVSHSHASVRSATSSVPKPSGSRERSREMARPVKWGRLLITTGSTTRPSCSRTDDR